MHSLVAVIRLIGNADNRLSAVLLILGDDKSVSVTVKN
jgi:hypothetical protein